MVVVAGSAGSCCWQGWVPSRRLSLPCGCSSPCCVFTWPFLCVLPSLVFLPLLTRTQVLLDQGPTRMTSLSSNYFLKGPSPNTVTWSREGGWTFTYEFWRGHESAHTVTNWDIFQACSRKKIKSLLDLLYVAKRNLPLNNQLTKPTMGSSLVFQWLRLHRPNAGGPGWISGQVTRSHMLQLRVYTLN